MRRFKITKGEVISSDITLNNQQIGEVLNHHGDVLCGDGTIYRIGMLQPENSKNMSMSDAINGGHVAVGDICQ